MAFEMFWYFQPRVAQIIAHGELSVSDLEQIHQQLTTKYFTMGHEPVHVMLDVRALTKFPTREAKVTALFDQILRHPRCGELLLIRADNPIQFFLMSSITQVLGNRFQQAHSLDDAIPILQGFDTSLYKIAI